MTRRGRPVGLLLAAVLGVVLAACGGTAPAASRSQKPAATTSTTRSVPTSTAPAATSTSPASSDPSATSVRSHLPAYAVTTRTIPKLGTILVDGKGRTLYLFVPDHDRGRSTCYGNCEYQWPALVLPKGVTRPVAAGGAKQSLLGTTRRKNGQLQVTYRGWPLYWFVYDGLGQATGEGLDNLGGLWYVLSPAGDEIR